MKFLPYICLALALFMSGSHLQKATDTSLSAEGFDLYHYARLPVQADGRIKPMDTFARNSLYLIYGKETLKQTDGSRVPAIQWLINLQMRPEASDDVRCFRIDNDDILGILGLQQAKEKFFSWNQIKPFQQTIFRHIGEIQKKQRSEQSVFDQQLLRLANAIVRYQDIASFGLPALVPPMEETSNNWFTLIEILQNENLQKQQKSSAMLFYRTMLESYHGNNPTVFNATSAVLYELLTKRPDTQKVNLEAFCLRFDAFLQAEILYVFSFILVCISWIAWTKPCERSARYIIVFSLLLHTFGLFSRMYIQDRPPVTNLYSSAIFVGWASALLGVVIEQFLKNGFGSAVAAICGFTTLLIAPALTGATDSMEMMQAVLDSNFWLATHVVTISLGYSAMFVTGCLAIIYVFMGVLTPSLDKEKARTLAGAVYAILCFAMLFSFVGTMLGGIWADQSWGRFWGWDPKENGALLIVLWCATMLHARWGGLCRTRGLMLLAIGGNIITALSWFGTNMISVGLHSYGFSDKQFLYLALFIGSQFLVIGLGLFPLEIWKSRKHLVG